MPYDNQSEVVIGGKSGSVEWHNARAVELYHRAASADVQPEVALGLLQEAASCFEGLFEIWHDSPLYQDWLAQCESRIACKLSSIGRKKESVAWWKKSIARHRQLQRQKFLEPQTTRKLASCEVRLATDLLAIDYSANLSKARVALLQSCRDYKRLVDEGEMSCLQDYYYAATGLANLEGDEHAGQGVRHAKYASALCDKRDANFRNEKNAGKFDCQMSEAKCCGWLRGMIAGLQIGAAYCLPMWAITFFGSAGAFISPVFQLLLLCTASVWIHKAKSARTMQGLAVFSFGLATGLPMVWAAKSPIGLVLMPMTAIAALLTVMFFDRLQRRYAVFYRSTSWVARASRRLDRTADAWAGWILRNVPRALHWLLLRRGSGEASVELRWCLQWAVCGYVFADEFSVYLVNLICSIDQVVDAPVRPPGVARQQPLVNSCASWSVRLRRPLHSPRSDGVLICA
jgi:hypothetical protein